MAPAPGRKETLAQALAFGNDNILYSVQMLVQRLDTCYATDAGYMGLSTFFGRFFMYLYYFSLFYSTYNICNLFLYKGMIPNRLEEGSLLWLRGKEEVLL